MSKAGQRSHNYNKLCFAIASFYCCYVLVCTLYLARINLLFLITLFFKKLNQSALSTSEFISHFGQMRVHGISRIDQPKKEIRHDQDGIDNFVADPSLQLSCARQLNECCSNLINESSKTIY